MAPSVKNYRSSLRNIPEERTCFKEPMGPTSAHTGHVTVSSSNPSHSPSNLAHLVFQYKIVFEFLTTHRSATCHDGLILVIFTSRSSSAHDYLQPPLTTPLPPSYVQILSFSRVSSQCPNSHLSSNMRHQVSNPRS
jgi:hypothetical protein